MKIPSASGHKVVNSIPMLHLWPMKHISLTFYIDFVTDCTETCFPLPMILWWSFMSWLLKVLYLLGNSSSKILQKFALASLMYMLLQVNLFTCDVDQNWIVSHFLFLIETQLFKWLWFQTLCSLFNSCQCTCDF